MYTYVSSLELVQDNGMNFECIRFACTALTQLFNTEKKSCSCFSNCSLLYQHRMLHEACVFQ